MGPAASSAEPVETIEVGDVWRYPVLDVVILPPAYGPIMDGGFGIFPNGSEDLAAHVYVEAAIEGIEALYEATALYAATMPGGAPLAPLTASTRVVGRDAEHADLADADVRVAWVPTANFVGNAGSTFYPDGDRTCDITLSTWFLFSMTPNDTRNVIMHEHAHCLGLRHGGPEKDMMYGTYPHYVGTPANPRDCASTLDLAALAIGYADPATHQNGWSHELRLPRSQYRHFETPATQGPCGNELEV